MFDKKNCMWILCVCEWIVNNELLYYSKLNQYLVFCPIKVLPIYDDVSARRITTFWHITSYVTFEIHLSTKDTLVQHIVYFWLFENVFGMRLKWRCPSMVYIILEYTIWLRYGPDQGSRLMRITRYLLSAKFIVDRATKRL